jgi:hypothetical protein
MERRDAAFQHRLPSVRPLAHLEDELIRRECSKYSLSYIFQDKSRDQRKRFRRLWCLLPPFKQRLILNWVLNRNAGHWIKCHKCGDPASKKHLEACVWCLSDATGAPSHMEMVIGKTGRLDKLNSIADAILEMTSDLIIMLPKDQ